jgi:tetratricopeptide (TPR) repeat protein
VTKATALQRKRETDKGSADKALQAASDAAKACPMVTAARAVNAEALAIAGRIDEAYAEADEALALPDDAARAHTAKASVLIAAGKVKEAEAEAQKAIDAGGGRDAKLLVASLAISAGNLDAAEAVLKAMLAERPQDADVQYNLALIADKQNRYNEARNGYLAALKTDPTYRAARYNLALLTFRRGVTEEAKNHARKYAEMAPNDPAAAQLLATIYGTSTPQPE